MNLYILNEVLVVYTPGMVVIAAESQERCKELFDQKFPSGMEINEFDGARIITIPNVDYPEGVVSYVYGGA